MENLESQKATVPKPSIVEHFGIEGLYGYRSISLSSRHAATILIAKNGSGKTTLLGALDAFLKGQFIRLAGLEFSTITCCLQGVAEPLVIHRNDIDKITRLTPDSQIWLTAKAWELDPVTLLDFIDNDFRGSDLSTIYDNPTYQAISTKCGYSYPNVKSQCDRLYASIQKSENVENIRSILKQRLAGIDIVYLPTYRRIELSIPETDTPRRGRRKPSIHARLGISKSGLHAGDIQFGLSDISDRLATLNQEMLVQSNQGYGEISANIINDLITGAFERTSPSLEQRPTKEALNLFFSRIKEGGDEGYTYRHARAYNFVQIPSVEKIFDTDSISKESNKFLTYFLGKLNSVMLKTRSIELQVEEFIRNCNTYLSDTDDETVRIKNSTPNPYTDDKVLQLDPQNLRVSVRSRSTKRRIPMDSLSSGEKQMISLFARLYLYPNNKIVLIDEPELSLSIAWQRKILPDILRASSCDQVIAITHSPFVFDNELEPYATSLKLRLDPVNEPELFSSDIEDDDDEGVHE